MQDNEAYIELAAFTEALIKQLADYNPSAATKAQQRYDDLPHPPEVKERKKK